MSNRLQAPQGVPGYGSRKFVVTMGAMMLGTAVTVMSMFTEPPEGFFTALAAFYILLSTCAGFYQWSNVRQYQHFDKEPQ